MLLLGIAFVAFAAAIVLFYLSASRADHQQHWMDEMRAAQAAAVDLAQRGADVTAGRRPDFGLLSSDLEEFDATLQGLRAGNLHSGMPALPGAARKQLGAVEQGWVQMKRNATVVAGAQKIYEDSLASTAQITNAAPGLAQHYAQIVKRAAAGGSGAGIDQATTQLALIGTMADTARAVNAGQSNPGAQIHLLEQQVAQFVAANTALGNSEPSTASLTRQAASTFAPFIEATKQLSGNAAALDAIQAAGRQLNNYGYNTFQPALFDLDKAVQALGRSNGLYQKLAYVAAVIALLALGAFTVLLLLAQIRRRRRAEERDRTQQQAILRLLDEITNLSDGDLTANMTVTENFTGAIADSINYTIETLRGLVGTINDTSEHIVSAAGRTRDTAHRMRAASEHQAKDVSAASTAMTRSSQQLQQASQRAQVLSAQASDSVQTAHSGTLTVGRTIDSMTALREQIQDTAKRVKRLGESSQEIGDITEVINDIAEQTNTLALNASIQAAMAGEAGRGFAIVAGEVQRLAERATAATRRIETLIKTIQTETGEAIVSMERSTSNVVSGAQSAEEAGQALKRIEASSQQLAGTIDEIAGATRNQSEVATRIASSMEAIRIIAVETSTSAGRTSEEIGTLNALSDRLRESVAGFKLPGSKPAAEPVARAVAEPATQ